MAEGKGGRLRRISRYDRPKGRITEYDLCRETMLAHRQPVLCGARPGTSDKSGAAEGRGGNG